MKRSLILSNYRIAFRKKNAPYTNEVSTLKWVSRFLDVCSIADSSQLRRWQIDYFLADLKKEGFGFDDILQARSAVLFLFERVLQKQKGAVHPGFDDEHQDTFETVRITA